MPDFLEQHFNIVLKNLASSITSNSSHEHIFQTLCVALQNFSYVLPDHFTCEKFGSLMDKINFSKEVKEKFNLGGCKDEEMKKKLDQFQDLLNSQQRENQATRLEMEKIRSEKDNLELKSKVLEQLVQRQNENEASLSAIKKESEKQIQLLTDQLSEINREYLQEVKKNKELTNKQKAEKNCDQDDLLKLIEDSYDKGRDSKKESNFVNIGYIILVLITSAGCFYVGYCAGKNKNNSFRLK
ncbi:hypothetical protein AB837_00597 [bacterium AB1]|nr:hypothetical protein AB837_00597 [bacterium AB1]